MPLVRADDPAVWAWWYQVHMPDGTIAGYERRAKGRILGEDHLRLRDSLNVTFEQRVVFVGAGFGWVAEDWAALGHIHLLCLDTSPYIHARKAEHADVPIHDIDILTVAGRDAVTTFLGGPAHFVISEDVLPSLGDEECVALDRAMHEIGLNVVHWITCMTPSPMNCKTAQEWKHLLPDSAVVPRGTATVL
jgi:hypothetical protein